MIVIELIGLFEKLLKNLFLIVVGIVGVFVVFIVGVILFFILWYIIIYCFNNDIYIFILKLIYFMFNKFVKVKKKKNNK